MSEPPVARSFLSHFGQFDHYPFPSLGRFLAPEGWFYVVADPAALKGREKINRFGKLERGNWDSWLLVLPLVTAVLGLLVSGKPWTEGGVWPALLGGLVGLVLMAAIWGAIENTLANRLRERVIPLGEGATEAWEICEVVEQIAATGAWQAQQIDPERRLARLAWRYVDTSTRLHWTLLDLARAEDHPSLSDMVSLKYEEVDATEQAMQLVCEHLNRVLNAAREIDRRQLWQWEEQARWREEQELRRRLAGPPLPFVRMQHDSHWSERMYLDAEAINELLRDSDRLISGQAR